MGRGEYLGELEIIVLSAVLRVGEEPYGMQIYDEIVKTTGRDMAVPSVYVTLSRMEKKGLLTSSLGEPQPTPGGKARKLYRITDAGRHALENSRRLFADIFEGLPDKLV